MRARSAASRADSSTRSRRGRIVVHDGPTTAFIGAKWWVNNPGHVIEDAGNHDVWHFHVHVFPRWRRDELYKHHDVRWTTAGDLAPYAAKLRAAL